MMYNYKKSTVSFILKAVLLVVLLISSSNIWAQSTRYTVMGKIMEEGSDVPVIGATVQIENTNFGTITDVDGNFKFEVLLESGDYNLTVRSVGYSSVNESISLGNNTEVNLSLSMGTDILSLSEVIVTGTSVATSKKQLGNAISTVKSTELTAGGAQGIDQALSGKIAGALVQQNSGDPAGGISIRLRGASTISGSSDPLYIIDGVFMSNSSNEVIDLGGSSQNRLVDINPEDIERIEVIKGAAAAAIYGSRASNGVVQIFTKRGVEGKAKFSFTTNVKFNGLRKKIDYNEVPLAWENPFDNNNLNTVPATRYDYQDEFFQNSMGTENFLSVSGGTQNTKYFASGSYLKNGGIIANTNFERFGARLSLNQRVNDWLSFDYGINYTQSTSKDIPNGGMNSAYGAITGFTFSDNQIDPTPVDGVYPVTSPLVPRTNPREAVDRFEFGQKTNRVITNLGINVNPFDGFNISYKLGIDYYNQSGTGYIPPVNTSPSPTGFASRGDVNSFQNNSDLMLSYEKNLTGKIVSTTSAGGSWQYEKFESLSITSDRLVAQVSTSGTILSQNDFRSKKSYWGGFIQQTFGFSDKLFVTGAVRMDGASVFSENNRNQVYGKASASYVISSEPFWSTIKNAVSDFKLRASWGQAGNLTALGAYDRFLNYNGISINGLPGAVSPNLQGNDNLAPERQDEIEFGFDMGFIKNRVGLEFTYYKQNVTDLLVQRELAPSSGFGTRFENVGSMENSGIELLLRAKAVQTKEFAWYITATYSANKNVVTEVIGDRITLPGSFATSFVIPGESLGVFYRQFYDRDAEGNIIYDANGYPSRGVTSEGESSKVIGDPNPDWFGSLTNELTYKGFAFRFQFDAVQGFDVFNWNRRLLDNKIFGGGALVGEELLGNKPKGLGGVQAGIFEEYVEDGSFVKLREVGLSYTIKPKTDAINSVKLSFIGRNLISFDKYIGWDPEINTPGQSNGVRGFDFAGVPIPRTFQFGVNVSF